MRGVGWDLLRDFETRDDALPLRRFMNFSKFQDLMDTGSLHLSPASVFKDKLEGHYTSRDYEAWDKQLTDWGFDLSGREMAKKAKATIGNHNQEAVVISCWTTATAYDLRMWEEYAESSEAVVLETTVGRLREALGTGYIIVPVRYLDFVEYEIPKDHSLFPFCYKRNSYDWEGEVRVIGEMEPGKRIGSPRKAPVDLSTLVVKVNFHPLASKLFVDSVIHLVGQKTPSAACEVMKMKENL